MGRRGRGGEKGQKGGEREGGKGSGGREEAKGFEMINEDIWNVNLIKNYCYSNSPTCKILQLGSKVAHYCKFLHNTPLCLLSATSFCTSCPSTHLCQGCPALRRGLDHVRLQPSPPRPASAGWTQWWPVHSHTLSAVHHHGCSRELSPM